MTIPSPRVSSFVKAVKNSSRTATLLQGLKTALAAALCYWLASRFGLHQGYWSAITSIIVMQSNVGSTIAASRDRILGTAIGALLGYAASPWEAHPAAFVVTVVIALLVCAALNLKNSARLAGVTVCIMLLTQHGSEPHWRIAFDRFLEVSLGIVIALAVSTFVLPLRARSHLQQSLAEEFGAIGRFFETMMRGYRAAMPDDVPGRKQALEALVLTNETLLQAARSEPIGGGASLESLVLLTEDGRALFDAVLALEPAIRESCNDRFADNYEPQLGSLVRALAAEFSLVSERIGAWHFDSDSLALRAEEDLKALEARVAAVRGSSIDSPLDEILRVYTVQLHLRQIVHLLAAAVRACHERADGAA